MEKNNEFITINDAAAILGCSWNFIRKHLVPKIETIKVGNKIMICEKSFRDYLEELKRKAALS